LLEGKCGVRAIPEADQAGVPVFVMAGIPRTDEFKKMFSERGISLGASSSSDFIDFSLLCSDFALAHAGLEPEKLDLTRSGVCIGSGMGSLEAIVHASHSFDKSYKKLSPYFISRVLINLAAGQVSMRHGFKGPNHAVATACATSANSIGDAYNFIRLNYADVMLAGGAECSTDPLTRAGFARMKALSTATDAVTASRPFDEARSGFVLGEGAGLLVLESLDHALSRGAEGQILAEVVGYGVSADSHHVTSPPPDGDGARRAMLSALRDAGLPDSLAPVGYINAHATSTPAGDGAECAAIESLLPHAAADTYVSSTKGATGHLLGAAGVVESTFAVMALQHGWIPPTLNLSDPDPVPSRFKHVNKALQVPNLKYAMSNSFGFGGVNVSLLFKKYER
jgi:3-oxoacyl-[acyl-carrier-protein] synthase II